MQKKGYVSFVLHAHLPFIHHPESDDYLEESWLYEAISETYIPLLQSYQKLVDEGVNFRITMTITPTLLSMFDNKLFKGWVCRTTLPDVEKRRKYLYNEGFSRATTLVGDYEGYDYVFVVEGYMDRLKFIQYGVKNVVAILGWKMSYEQEKKLKAFGINHIISALDNDECGKKGTSYLKSIFKKVTRFCYLKGVKDPGEMNNKNFDVMYKKTMKKYAQDRRKQ